MLDYWLRPFTDKIDLMPAKRIELFIINIAEDISEAFKGYSKFEVERLRGNLWFFKDQLQADDAVKIEEGKTYNIEDFVQIQNMSLGKSKPTISGTLS